MSDLPVLPPIEPMLAKLSDALPPGDGYLFEPKWDGFRAIVFRSSPSPAKERGTGGEVKRGQGVRWNAVNGEG